MVKKVAAKFVNQAFWVIPASLHELMIAASSAVCKAAGQQHWDDLNAQETAQDHHEWEWHASGTIIDWLCTRKNKVGLGAGVGAFGVAIVYLKAARIGEVTQRTFGSVVTVVIPVSCWIETTAFQVPLNAIYELASGVFVLIVGNKALTNLCNLAFNWAPEAEYQHNANKLENHKSTNNVRKLKSQSKTKKLISWYSHEVFIFLVFPDTMFAISDTSLSTDPKQ